MVDLESEGGVHETLFSEVSKHIYNAMIATPYIPPHPKELSR